MLLTFLILSQGWCQCCVSTVSSECSDHLQWSASQSGLVLAPISTWFERVNHALWLLWMNSCFCFFSEKSNWWCFNYSTLFLKAEENTRFVMKSSLPFCHCSVSLVGVKYTIVNKCLHKQEYSSPVAGLEQWTVCC